MNENSRMPNVNIAGIAIERRTVDHRKTARPTRRVKRHSALIVALGSIGLGLVGCGADTNNSAEGSASSGVAPSGGTSVTGSLDEWHVLADVATAPAGPITFTFKNTGTVVHEMLITRTDAAPGKIAIDPATKKFNEDDPTSKVIDEVSELDPGKTGSVTIDLAPGTYQLVCNVAGHYADGMYMTFTVTP